MSDFDRLEFQRLTIAALYGRLETRRYAWGVVSGCKDHTITCRAMHYGGRLHHVRMLCRLALEDYTGRVKFARPPYEQPELRALTTFWRNLASDAAFVPQSSAKDVWALRFNGRFYPIRERAQHTIWLPWAELPNIMRNGREIADGHTTAAKVKPPPKRASHELVLTELAASRPSPAPEDLF